MVIFLSPPHAALRDGPVSACLPRLAPSRLWEWWAGPRLWQGPNSSATRGHFSFCWYFCWYFQHATNWNQALMRVSRHFSIPCDGPFGGFTSPHTASKPALAIATAGFSLPHVMSPRATILPPGAHRRGDPGWTCPDACDVALRRQQHQWDAYGMDWWRTPQGPKKNRKRRVLGILLRIS